MAHRNTVLRSVNGPGGEVCVDLFRRPDGSHGFDLFRRDVEDGAGWFAIGGFGATEYATADQAWDSALETVPWLRDAAGA